MGGDMKSRVLCLFLGFVLFWSGACAKHSTLKKETKAKKGIPPYSWIVQSNLLAFEGNLEKSVELLLKAIEALPKDPTLKYLVAERYAGLNRLEEAKTYIQEALQSKPHWKEAQILWGEILEAKGNYEEAEVIFRKLLAKNSNDEKLYFNLAQNLVHQEKYTAALNVLQQLSQKKPDSLTALFYMATLYNVYLKNEEGALKIFKKILLQDPSNTRVRNQMAQIYLKNNHYKEALEQLLAIEKFSPQDLGIKMQIAFLYQEQKEISKAISKLKEVLEINPQADRIPYYLGLLFGQLKDFPTALHYFSKVSPDSSLYKDARLQEALIYHDLGENTKAVQIMEEAIKKKPEIASFYQFLSYLWEEQNELNLAIESLKRGVHRLPKVADFYFSLGLLYEKMGDKERSIQMMREVLEIDPQNAQALNYIGYIYAEGGENLEEAQKLIQKALEIKPDDGYIIDSLGWVYFQKGDLNMALHYLQKAHKVVPKEPTILEHLGDLFLKMGNKKEALKFFKQAFQYSSEKEKKDLKLTDRLKEKIQNLSGK